MRHSGRPGRIRRGRLVAAAASAVTVAVSVLASTGIIPVAAPSGDRALADGPRDVAESRRSASVERAGGRGEGGSRAAARNAAPAGDRGGSRAEQVSAEEPRTSGISPDDSLPPDSGEGKRIVYRLSTNQVWLVGQDGRVRRSYLVSGTKFDQVKPGAYDVMRKRRNTISFHGTERMEYMVTFTEGENAAIGFHDIPVDIDTGRPVQSLSDLGTSLSAGCVRQKQADARALWNFAPVGTPVIVLA